MKFYIRRILFFIAVCLIYQLLIFILSDGTRDIKKTIRESLNPNENKRKNKLVEEFSFSPINLFVSDTFTNKEILVINVNDFDEEVQTYISDIYSFQSQLSNSSSIKDKSFTVEIGENENNIIRDKIDKLSSNLTLVLILIDLPEKIYLLSSIIRWYGSGIQIGLTYYLPLYILRIQTHRSILKAHGIWMETNKINLKNEINEISEKFGDSSIVLGIEQSTYIDFFRLTEFLHINHMFRQSENLNFCLGEFYQISNNYICSIKGFLTSINYLKKRSSSVLWYEKKYFSFIYQFPPNSLRSTSNRYFIDNSQELPNLVLMVKTRNSVQINILQKSIKKRNFLLLPDLIIRKEEKKLSNISLIVDRQLKHSNCANYFYDNNTNEDIIQTEFKINPKLSSGLDVIDYYKYFTSNTIARYRQEKGIDNWWKNINNKNERNLNVLGKNLNYESEMNYYYVSEQQLCRPLAFSILVHEEFEQLERFILSIYQPQHLYCIHVDNKMERLLFYLTAKLFARNFHNIIVIDRREDVEWGEFSLLKAHLNCFEELRKYSNGLNGMKKFSLTSQLKNYIEQIPCGTISWQYVIPCTFQTVNLLPMMEMSRMFYDENNGKISLYCHCGRDTLKFLIYRLFGENEMALNAKFKDNVIYTNCSLAISNEFYEFKLRKEIREKFPEISLFFFRYHIIYVATNVQKNETFIVSLAKSSLYVGLRREFVNFIFDNPFAQRFFQFLSHMFISDEIIFQSLLCECLKVESKLHSMFINRYRLYINSKNRCAGNKSMNFEKKKYFNVWKKDNYSSLKASSTNQMRTSFSLWNSDICAKIVHGVCIGTIRDLYWISRVKTAFFNKIKFNIDVLAFECLEERRINRTIIPSKYPVGNLGQITFS